MKRKVVSALAVLSLVAILAAPAMADLNTYSVPGNTVQFPGQAGRSHDLPMCWGFVNSAGTDLLPPSVSVVAGTSSTITVTFGLKWAYYQPFIHSGNNYGSFALLGARFSVFWDTVELSPVLPTPIDIVAGGGPAGLTMLPDNYSPTTLGGFLASVDASADPFITGVGLFANRGAGTTVGPGGLGMSEIAHDQLVKVGKATFHVDPGAHPADGLDLFITGCFSGRFYTDISVSTTSGEWFTTRIWSSLIAPSSVFLFCACPGGYDVVPEPASAGLFGVGLLAMVGGVWRRRRRRLV